MVQKRHSQIQSGKISGRASSQDLECVGVQDTENLCDLLLADQTREERAE